MKQRHNLENTMLLPQGYQALKPGFGDLIRSARSSRGIKQAALADDGGISRETLSRIEGGRAPRMRTLDRLLHELNLEISDVAVNGSASKALVFTEGRRGDVLAKIGTDLERRRRADNRRSLRALAAKVGISPPTLSRIERGQSPRSRVFGERAGQDGQDFHDRAVEVANDKLKRYLEGVDFDAL